MTTIGMRIRALRQEAGWTQAELGTPEFSKAYISQIESGRVTPSLATLSVIAAKLGTTLEALLPQGDQGHRLQDLERLWRAAERLQEHGEHATAIELVEQAARLSTASSDPKLRGEGHMRYARTLQLIGQTQSALDECEEAIEAFGGAGDPQLLGRAYNLAGLIYRDLGEWAAARRYFLRALRLYPRRVVWHSRVLINLANLLARAGSLSEASEYARRAIDLTHTYGDGEQEALARLALSFTLIETDELQGAIQELDVAERMLRAAGKESLVRLCRHNRVIAHHRMGLQGAEEDLMALLREAEEGKDGDGASAICAEIARQALRDARYPDAIKFAAQGVNHARAGHSRLIEARLLLLEAEAHVHFGAPEQGAQALLLARDLFIELRQGRYFQQSMDHMAQFLPVKEGLVRVLFETPARGSTDSLIRRDI